VLVDIKNLRTYFYTEDGVVPAVDDVDLTIHKGEVVGLVGESGRGKSVTLLSIMRLIPNPPGKIISGEIFFHGEDLLKKNDEEMRMIQGDKISMIFQEPMTSLNPVYTVGDQISEAITLHQNMDEAEAKKRTVEMLRLVGIPEPERRYGQYPHEMSGGMRQRVMIAMALSSNPELLISDKATTALDVTIQAQILDLMRGLQKKLGMAILIITHNLAVVAEMAETIAIADAGKIVENAPAKEIFKAPRHPYTYGLLQSIPKFTQRKTNEPLPAIEGMVPSPYHMPTGCRFNPRCPFATEKCREEEPEILELTPGHLVRCFHRIEL
jgi:peptide/nickel transport system ATP-binding protein/oligopeptide transport system ATP-binding protein